MDRLARCPECGSVTHPLAEHLNKSADDTTKSAGVVKKPRAKKARKPSKVLEAAIDSTVVPTPSDSVRCDNCGQPLGKLQRGLAWNEHQVCGPCHRTLSVEKHGATPEPVSTAIVSRHQFPGRDCRPLVVAGVRDPLRPACHVRLAQQNPRLRFHPRILGRMPRPVRDGVRHLCHYHRPPIPQRVDRVGSGCGRSDSRVVLD